MAARPTSVKEVTIDIKGVTHQGTYFVQNKMVHVQSTFGNKATQVGSSPAEALARLLLSELVRSSKG